MRYYVVRDDSQYAPKYFNKLADAKEYADLENINWINHRTRVYRSGNGELIY